MPNLGTVQVIQGNALALPLEDNSVDLICTSPPYFGLRSYQDAGEHYDGQIGSEATPAEFLDALIAATREMVRVLKPSGSIFVNLGDKYAGGGGGSSDGLTGRHDRPPRRAVGIPTKSLMGMPWRYALRCIDQLGLILRAEIIWNKPNGLPESVTDRVRRSHEQWFHFVKMPRYFAAVDEIREGYEAKPQRRFSPRSTDKAPRQEGRPRTQHVQLYDEPSAGDNPLGKLPGSVWSIPTQPLTVPPELGIDHFAAYPMEWPRRLIQGWTPTGICTACDQPRTPVVDKRLVGVWHDKPAQNSHHLGTKGAHQNNLYGVKETFGNTSATITGYTCGCPTPTAPTRPSVCLDPFGGTGTTALVAKALGRIGITVDLSADYCRLAEWRCNNPQELAAALQVEKPDVIPDDQLSLFGDLA